MALVRRGSRAAFEVLVGRYQTRLLAFCRHLVGSKEDAEDVLQEVMASAFNAMQADDRPIHVRPWLYRIARNRCLNHLRRAQPIGVDSMDVHLSDHGASTADKVHARERFRLLVDDIQRLPESQRSALVLREMDALSYEQIAEAMETTVPSVKSLLVRARISLAEAAEARQLHCPQVRIELAEVAEGLSRRSGPLVRRHIRTCGRCASFERQLKHTKRSLAAFLPIGGVALARKLALLHIGHSAGTGSGATGSAATASGATGATATTASAGGVGGASAGVGGASVGVGTAGGVGAGTAGGVGAGTAGGVTAGGLGGITAGAGGATGAATAVGGVAGGAGGGLLTAGAGVLATKAAAGLAAAALVTAGATMATGHSQHSVRHASAPAAKAVSVEGNSALSGARSTRAAVLTSPSTPVAPVTTTPASTPPPPTTTTTTTTAAPTTTTSTTPTTTTTTGSSQTTSDGVVGGQTSSASGSTGSTGPTGAASDPGSSGSGTSSGSGDSSGSGQGTGTTDGTGGASSTGSSPSTGQTGPTGSDSAGSAAATSSGSGTGSGSTSPTATQ